MMCTSRCAGHSCTLPEHHESRHESGNLSWDHELIPDGTIEVRIANEGTNSRAISTRLVPDPKRRRPPEYLAPTGDGRATSTGRSLAEIVAEPNPYWDDQGNRIMQDPEPYG